LRPHSACRTEPGAGTLSNLMTGTIIKRSYLDDFRCSKLTGFHEAELYITSLENHLSEREFSKFDSEDCLPAKSELKGAILRHVMRRATVQDHDVRDLQIYRFRNLDVIPWHVIFPHNSQPVRNRNAALESLFFSSTRLSSVSFDRKNQNNLLVDRKAQ